MRKVKGTSEEAAEMLECRSVEMCCLQEPRV